MSVRTGSSRSRKKKSSFGGYFIYQSRNVLARPKVFTENLDDYNIVNNSFLPIKGKAKNTISLFLNGRKIFTDENGFFEEDLILTPGYNIIQIKAEDRFKNEATKNYVVILDD